jgi:hypothetical protein
MVRLTPEGTLIVIKRFSVKLPDGVHGFPAGKEVRILSEEANEFVVTDGQTEGRAPKDHFTNNIDEADKITGSDRDRREAYEKKVAELADGRQAASEVLQQRQIELELTQLEHRSDMLRIKAQELQLGQDKLNQRIEAAKRQDGAATGRFDGMTDLWELSERNKRAISKNEEAQAQLSLKIQKIRSDLAAAEAAASIIRSD